MMRLLLALFAVMSGFAAMVAPTSATASVESVASMVEPEAHVAAPGSTAVRMAGEQPGRRVATCPAGTATSRLPQTCAAPALRIKADRAHE